jgi:hypothetical protein
MENEETIQEERGPVQKFLDDMANAMTSGDTERLAGMWQAPSYVIGDDMERAVNTPEEVKQFFAGAKDSYNARGVTGTRGEIEELQWITDRMVIVTVRWPYIDAKGNENGDERSTYLLRRDKSNELKVCVAMLHGEFVEH